MFTKSEKIDLLAKSLSQFQSEIKNPANTAINPFFKSKYAPLNDVLNLVRPILSKYGLSISQSPSSTDGNTVSITTLLMHESGQWIESEQLVLKTDKATAQGAGSSITYARRYALSAILGISSEDDDDGNITERQEKKSQQTYQKKSESGEKKSLNYKAISESQLKRLYAISSGYQDLAKKIVNKYYESSKDISTSDYEAICNEIEAEISKVKKEA